MAAVRKGVQELAIPHREEAISTIAAIMGDETEQAKDRLKAASMLLDRSDGTPVPAVAPTAENKRTVLLMKDYTDEELEAYALEGPVYQRVSDMEPVEAEFEPSDPSQDPLVQ